MKLMEKEVIIKKVMKNSDERPRRERKRIYRTSGGRHVHGFDIDVDIDIDEEIALAKEIAREFRKGNGGGVGINRGSGRGQRNNHGEDRGEGRHINNGRRDGVGPHHEEDGCNVKPDHETSPEDRGHRFFNERHEMEPKRSNVETKLFTDKAELVKYVNDRKADNSEIEIYKIEDGLYKLVIRH